MFLVRATTLIVAGFVARANDLYVAELVFSCASKRPLCLKSFARTNTLFVAWVFARAKTLFLAELVLFVQTQIIFVAGFSFEQRPSLSQGFLRETSGHPPGTFSGTIAPLGHFCCIIGLPFLDFVASLQ